MKRNTVLTCALSLILALSLALPVYAAQVAQGKCLKYDPNANMLTIEEYDLNFGPDHRYGKPTGKELTVSTAQARANNLIGITPTPGDILRIAFTEDNNQKVAVRVMNVTRQNLMKK